MKDRGSMADNFENSWKEAFDKIAIEPDVKVWEGIDRTLANREVVLYRRKALIYKWAAVIALIFAITISIPGYLNTDKKAELADSNSESFLLNLSEPSYSFLSENQRIYFGLTKSDEDSEGQEFEGGTNGNHYSGSESAEYNLMASYQPSDDVPDKVEPKALFVGNSKPEEQHIYLMPDYSARRTSRARYVATNDDKFWAGVGVGSSTFDPNYQLTQPDDVLTSLMSTGTTSSVLANSAADIIGDPGASYSDSRTVGSNYQVGLNMGMLIGNRLTIESGFAYAQSQLNSQTDRITENRLFATAVSAKEQLTEKASARQDVVEYTREELDLNNTFQFASVPVKAGYLVLDKKINIKLNAGVVANFYMGNTITGQDGNFESVEVNPGLSSPYRTVSFSGITGVSVGYNFLNNFDLIVEPNYSQALQPLTRVESDFNASPSGFGMMAGLRYRFRR